MTLLDVVSDTARQRPGHTAVVFQGARVSYARLERLSNALAAGLVAHGVKKGDRVALMMPNCPQSLIGLLGVWKAGAFAVPCCPLWSEPELRRALIDCGIQAALVLTPFYARIKAAQPGSQLRCIIATNIKEYLPVHLRVLFSALKEKREGHRIVLQEGDLWLGDLLRQFGGAGRPGVEAEPSDTALLICTGGTTGTPKAAMGTHQALLMTAMQLRAWFGVAVDEWDDAVLGNMPLFHVFGIAVTAAALVGHHPIVLIPDPRDLDYVIATIARERVALLPGVPALFVSLLNHPRIQGGRAALRSLKLCVSGAAPLMLDTKNRFEALTGGRIVEAYSLTEGMAAAVVTPVLGRYKPRAVGIPLPDVKVRITDAEDGCGTLPPGEVGEILLRAPNLMQGYWHRPDETKETVRDGWLYTGDLGYLDEDGYLFVVDRKKDLIKPSGRQVWPREVEEAIASHPAVAEVGVAGVVDEQHGELVKAWVVLRPGRHVSAGELKAHCEPLLAHYKVPKRIEFRDGLPKSAVGKVLRRELVRSEASG
jgi:long-chain acyl-CoA synthetase